MTKRVSIRSGRGLGDSLYLQSVARHLIGQGYTPEVCTLFPDVFRPLLGRLKVSPFRRDRIDRVAHYITRKNVKGTDQFSDCCINAGIAEPVEFKLDWTVSNKVLAQRLRESGNPVVVVQLPRAPMGRVDGYGMDLLPDCRAIQKVIDRLKPEALIVQVGKGEPLYQFEGVDIDLANTTSVSDVIDVVSVANGCLGYCSFIVPLAESLGKPALLVWSRKGLASQNSFIQAITPDKIFHCATSAALMDDCTDDDLTGAVDAFCHQIGGSGKV